MTVFKMTHVHRYLMAPQNGITAGIFKFCPNFRMLRLSWTANSPRSEGMEQFVEEYLPKIRENNPQIKYFLHRSYVEWDPWVVGEFQWNRFRKRRVVFKTKHQILALVEEMAIGGDYREGQKRRVQTRLPRGQELWSTETLGHDVYKVESKWKGDSPNPDEITVENHPHYLHRKF
uniref:Ribosomal protein/NADH dehydrogenase domain-containing protein n=1 Tax=Panagrolaimus sp. JU765 TaxID=591449 RepID=A0AC34Q756_9BILA